MDGGGKPESTKGSKNLLFEKGVQLSLGILASLKFLVADPSWCNGARWSAYIISHVSSPYTRGE
jgi:hypothetical protein